MQGKLIVIDGTDGTGKTTQVDRITGRLRDAGHSVSTLHFPRYGEPSAWFVEQFLHGEFGALESIPKKAASLFYALDRYAAAPDLRRTLESGTHLVLDRYISSNIGHQAARFDTPEERAAYVAWNEEIEYGILEVPKPDVQVVLHLDIDHTKRAQQIQGKLLDILESNDDHLRRAERAYLEAAASHPGWVVVECGRPDGTRLSIEEVTDAIWSRIAPALT